MEFIERQTEYPGKRKMVIVDENNIPVAGESPIFVNLIHDEGDVEAEGTPISAENLNKGNWRDDESVSFKKQASDNLPSSKALETQIITKSNGETWLIPPTETNGVPKEIGKQIDETGTAVQVGNVVPPKIIFSSDPQTQITTAQNTADNALVAANSKSVIKVNSTKMDVNFTSDPQTQINDKQTQINNLQGISNPTFISNLLNMIYPIGAIYMSTQNTNPNSTIGGTWVPWGTGCMPVGYDASDSDFNSVNGASEAPPGKEGGNKATQQHSHTTDTANLKGSFKIDNTVHFLYDPSNGNVTGIASVINNTTGRKTSANSSNSYNAGFMQINASHSHGTTVFGTGAAASAANGNMPPYKVCYMWRRKA